jgi:outer membrane protein assembly factor BamD
MITRSFIVMVVLVVSMAVGCSSKSKATKSNGQVLSGTDEQIFIGDTIEKNYDPNVIMKRAESFFEKEEYPEAIIEYQHFLDLHRVHTLASYALFKLAESHFKQIKTVDRDPDPVHKALEMYERLRREYPGSRYDADAVERINACHTFIAQTHMFVGQFYYRRDAYLAAAHRFETVVTRYPDMEVAGDALYYLALTYNELGADDWAREKLAALAERFPQNAHASSGRKLLAQLNAKQKTEAVALSTPQFNGADSEISVSMNGAGSQPMSPPTMTPVTALRSSPNASSPAETTLCRLGVWC